MNKPITRATLHGTMSNTNNKTNKTDSEILLENEDRRTKCTGYTRVMGYHRPVETFNNGKQGEFEERTHFIEPTACNCK